MKQDARAIFDGLPVRTRTVALALTNAAAAGDEAREDVVAKTDYGERAVTALGMAGSLVRGGLTEGTASADGERGRGKAVPGLAKLSAEGAGSAVGEGGKAVLGLAGSFVRGGSAKGTETVSAEK